jgi:hypothetical protein
MKIIFRTSEYKKNFFKKKIKFSQIEALKNLTKKFKNTEIYAVCDSIKSPTFKKISSIINKKNIISINLNNNSGSLLYCINLALGIEKNSSFKPVKKNEIIYFVENDYIHLDNSKNILINAFKLKADYVSLYDHPDKYGKGSTEFKEKRKYEQFFDNPDTKVILGDFCHYKTSISTTCTFATKFKTLQEDYNFFLKMCKKDIPRDHKIFKALTKSGRNLYTPIPSFSTHTDKKDLAPLRNWFNKKLR